MCPLTLTPVGRIILQVSWFERLRRKVGTSLGIDNVSPFPLSYYNSKIKGLSGKNMGQGVTVHY